MKAGRPSLHIRARWISVGLPNGGRSLFKLDNKGNICSINEDVNIERKECVGIKPVARRKKTIQGSKPKTNPNNRSQKIFSTINEYESDLLIPASDQGLKYTNQELELSVQDYHEEEMAWFLI